MLYDDSFPRYDDDPLFLACDRPNLPFAFAAYSADTAWAYASCGHVIHQHEKFMLGEMEMRGEVLGPSFGFWDRAMGHVSRACSLCTFRHVNNIIVCAMCGTLIGINYPACVRDYIGDRADKPYWQYATRLKGHQHLVITCPYARCSSTSPLYSGRWNGDRMDAYKRAIYLP